MTEFTKQREVRFNHVLDRLHQGNLGDVGSVISPAEPPEIWIEHEPTEPAWRTGDVEKKYTRLFRAYFDVRFKEQRGYARYVTREQNDKPVRRHWPWYPGMALPLKLKRTLLWTVWVVCLLAAMVSDLIVLLGPFTSRPTTFGLWIHLAVVWSALIAVAAKTLSEGLAVNRELLRYEEYFVVVNDIATTFQHTDDVHLSKKWRLMVEMEKASFAEMRDFLRSHYEAMFVM